MPTSMRAVVSRGRASTTSKVLDPAWLTNTWSCAEAGGGGGDGVLEPHEGNPAHESASPAIRLAQRSRTRNARERWSGRIISPSKVVHSGWSCLGRYRSEPHEQLDVSGKMYGEVAVLRSAYVG